MLSFIVVAPVLIGVFILFAIFRVLTALNYFTLSKFPAPPRHWLFGHVNHPWKPGPTGHSWFIQQSEKYRDLYIFWISVVPHVVPTNAEYTKIVCNSLTPKSYGYSYLREWMGTGLLTNNDPDDWRRKRRMLTPAFHFNVLHDYVAIFAKNTKRLLRQWDLHVQEGRDTVDMQMDMTYLSLDNIGECAFGVDFGAIDNHDSPFIAATLKASRHLMDRFVNPLFGSSFLWNLTSNGRDNRAALRVLHEQSISAINKRAKELAEGKDATRQKYFLDILLTARDEDGSGLSFKEMQDEVDTFMFEGHDTTSSGMMWTIYCISQHADVESRVTAEIDEVLGDREPTYDDLQKVKSVDAACVLIVASFLPLSGVSRTIDVDLRMGPYHIPKGSNVSIQPLNVHMNPDHWTDPYKFDPERFLPDNCVGRHPFAYIPFSAGPRNCIGQNFALTEEKCVLALIYRRYVLRYKGPDARATMYGEMTLRNQGPLEFTLLQRKRE